MGKVLFRHGGTKLPPRWNRMFPTVERISLRISTANVTPGTSRLMEKHLFKHEILIV